MTAPGFLERLAGEVALYAIALGQRLALRRHDVHEAQHFTAMVLYGNSNHTNSRCMLPASFWPDGEELAHASREARAKKDDMEGLVDYRPTLTTAQAAALSRLWLAIVGWRGRKGQS